MIRATLMTVFLACVVGGTSAHGASFSIGSHFGFAWIHGNVEDTGSSTVFAIPSATLTYQPGLRISVSDLRRVHEVHVDSGALILDQAGSTISLISASLGYQLTFRPAWRNAPYLSLDVGLFREGSAVRVSTAPSLGAGVGVRRLVRDHGALRCELRVDRLANDDAVGRPRLTTTGLRFGFDLWL